GVGGREVDYRAVGADFSHRHERQDQQIAIMKKIWNGQPPFDGADPVGPTPVQAGGPPILAGVMGPKAMARAAQWADGVYSFSMSGSAAETAGFFKMAEQAWQAADREKPPQKVGGFWYCLADNAEEKMKDYVYDYLQILGESIARPAAASLEAFDKHISKDALAEMASAGCEEVFLCSATDGLSELDRLLEIL